MLNKIIPITALIIFFSFVVGQSISVYPKKGAKIKMKSGIAFKERKYYPQR